MRGRPPKSIVRKNLIDILFVLKKSYGYELAIIYNKLFPKVTQRLIYYHLNRGAKTGEFKIQSIKEEKGNYSWGSKAEKKYYLLGPKAIPNPTKGLLEELRKIKNDKHNFNWN